MDEPDEPVDTGRSARRRWTLVVVVVAVIALALGLFFFMNRGARVEITDRELSSVQLGETKAEVAETLGEPQDEGGLETADGREYDDCWFYTVVDPPIGEGDAEAAICFEGGTVAVISTTFS